MLHQPIPASAFALDYLSLSQHESAAESALIALADPGPDSRILLLGSHTLEMQCALLRRGCGCVVALRLGTCPRTDEADLVLLPTIDSQGDLAQAIAQARRALAPLGTLALHLDDVATSTLARQARRLLPLHGFEAIRMRPVATGTICRAELPLHGLLARA